LEHYFRTYGDKLQKTGSQEPDFVSDFKFTPAMNVKGKLRALKKYGYDLKKE
jgi:hypothetical protein